MQKQSGTQEPRGPRGPCPPQCWASGGGDSFSQSFICIPKETTKKVEFGLRYMIIPRDLENINVQNFLADVNLADAYWGCPPRFWKRSFVPENNYTNSYLPNSRNIQGPFFWPFPPFGECKRVIQLRMFSVNSRTRYNNYYLWILKTNNYTLFYNTCRLWTRDNWTRLIYL
jgi:hypothetical protein